MLACCAHGASSFRRAPRAQRPHLPAAPCWRVGALLWPAPWSCSAEPGGGYRGLFVVDAFATFMKLLVIAGAALSVVLALDYNEQEGHRALRVPGAGAVRGRRHDGHVLATNLMTLYLGLELQSLLALRAGRLRPRRHALGRSRAQVSSSSARSPPACCCTASRCVYGFAGTMDFGRARPAARQARRRLGRADRRRGVHRRRAGVQALGGAVPHVDARRLRRRAHARSPPS